MDQRKLLEAFSEEITDNIEEWIDCNTIKQLLEKYMYTENKPHKQNNKHNEDEVPSKNVSQYNKLHLCIWELSTSAQLFLSPYIKIQLEKNVEQRNWLKRDSPSCT